MTSEVGETVGKGNVDASAPWGARDVPIRSVMLVISSLGAGGAERVVSALAALWAEKGWRLTVLTFSGSKQDHYALHPAVRRIAFDLIGHSTRPSQKLRSNIKRVVAVRDAVYECRPDVVVSFVDQTNIIVLAALIASRRPVVVSERIDPTVYRVASIWQLARFLLYRTAAAVVVQTASAARWAATVVPSHKVQTIPNFVRGLPAPNHERSDKFILGVGRLDRQKGFDLLIEAFALSRVGELGYRLVILGEGVERGRLTDLARRLGVLNAVDMPGAQPTPERWMATASVFVLSSRFEGFPNVLLEAMAMGCPVIAADCPSGPREVVRDGDDGLIVASEDAPALAEALRRILTDSGLRRRLGESAVAVRERFDAARIVGMWERVIDAVATGE